MGCTQSKAKEEPKKDEFTDLQQVGQPTASPERSAAASTADAASAAEASDAKVAGGPAKSKRAKDKRFQNGGPTDECASGEITSCFKTGLLFRITVADTWYFYNDTTDYEMSVTYNYGPLSDITILDADKVAPAEGSDWPSVVLKIYPGETKRFIKGSFNGYKSKYNATGLSAEYKERMAQQVQQRVDTAIAAVAKLGTFDSEEARLKACVAKKVPYVDMAFKPVAESLSRKDDSRQIAPTAWMRPTEFLQEDQHSSICVFNEIEPNDIDQGQLGDCWFLCSVASLAEFPAKIKDIFVHPVSVAVAKAEQSVGAYRVTFNKNGWWHTVIVDDYFPCVGSRPCFAKNVQDVAELWPSLIEKAYAKLHGSYASITGGDALHALSDLTGYPTNRFDTEWEEAVNDKDNKGLTLWADILRYDQEGYLINLNTPGVDNSAYMGAHGAGNSKEFQEKYAAAGLGMGHAYSVMKVLEFPKHGIHLMQIRNPWGSGTEWTGAWSDKSDKWSKFPDIAKACQIKDEPDGTFWMAWSDIKKYFDGGGVCFTKFNWFDYRVQGAFEAGTPNLVLEVTVTEDVEAFIILSQKDRRGAERGSVDAKYAAVMMSVCKPDVGTNRIKVDLSTTSDADKPKEGFTFLYSRDVALKYTFSAAAHPGKPHLVIPRIFDSSIAKKDYVLGLITSKPVAPGKMTVKFRRLPADAPVFKNYKGFSYDPTAAAVVENCPYQFNPEVGAPVTRSGSEVQAQ